MKSLSPPSSVISLLVPSSNVSSSRVVSAHVLGRLFMLAGICALIYRLFFPGTGFSLALNMLLIVDMFALSVVCTWAAERLSGWTLHLMLTVGTVLVSCASYATGGNNPPAFFYLWICLFAFYFFPIRQALAHLSLIGLAYAFVLHQANDVQGMVALWSVALGTLVVVGPMVSMVRGHLSSLIEHLGEAATHDALTGLVNRRGLDSVFQLELERARRGSRKLSLLVGDLDFFKQVNDGYGHGEGDRVLVRIADIFRTNVRRIDTVARMGGEEFTILLPETDAIGAFRLAEKLRTRVEEAFEGDPVKLTISFGVSSYGPDGKTSEELLRAGDKALYAAKELGRNRCVTYSTDVNNVLSQAMAHRQARNKTHMATLMTLAEALDLRDNNTGSHSKTVGCYAEMMAIEMGLRDEDVERVRLAGILHDIGKIGVPDSVLLKAGPLTDTEWMQMKKHPEIGARILGQTDLDDIRSWVMAHHERVDGTGYPHGLGDSEIPMGAKILAVADAYEAMTADRVYRKALGHDVAREELVRCSGSHFNEEVVQAFLSVLARDTFEDRRHVYDPMFGQTQEMTPQEPLIKAHMGPEPWSDQPDADESDSNGGLRLAA